MAASNSKKTAGWKYAKLEESEDAELEDAHGPSDRSIGLVSRKPRNRSSQESDKDAAVDDVHQVDHDDDEPTAEDLSSLRRVADALPWSAFLVALVEMCERFTYYGLSGPFQNYISNRYNDPANPGALGLGQSSATALTNFFMAWSYLTPVLGAIVSDQYLGKYRTIVLFAGFYLAGLVTLFITSLPYGIEHGIAFFGLIISMFLIGLGTGGIKSNVSPLIAEQITEDRPKIKILRSGERVIVDPDLTVERVFFVFYACINIGSLGSIATTNLELHVGFWSAYFLALCMFVICFLVLVGGRKHYVVKPPQGSVIVNSLRVLFLAARDRSGLDNAKPSVRRKLGIRAEVAWNDRFVDELKKALGACKVFLFFPVYWMVFNQMMNNFVSSASQMELHGIPNDLMQNIDPLTIVFFIPICNNYLYPWLRRYGIALKPITRIFLGFILGSCGMAYAAYVQTLIYNAPPCFTEPLNCPAAKLADGSIEHNHVHVAVQAPAYFFIALSEIFASITGLEYAYSQAPASMKSFIMSLFLLTTAGGALLGALVAPWARDPTLTTLYMGLAVVSLGTGAVFWVLYGRGQNVGGEELAGGSFDEHASYALAPLSEDGRALRLDDSDEDGIDSGRVETRPS